MSGENQQNEGGSVAKDTHADGRRVLAPNEVSRIIEHKIERTDEVPKDLDQVVALSSAFVKDMGIAPGADVDRRGRKVAESVLLRRQIAELRQEILDELRELKRRSERYAHVAESAGHWAVDARHFVDSHPNLLWFLKEKKGKRG